MRLAIQSLAKTVGSDPDFVNDMPRAAWAGCLQQLQDHDFATGLVTGFDKR